MTDKKAIDILTRQRDKLSDQTIYKDETWTFQTASYIKDFFGKQSPEYIFIGQFQFSVLGHSGMSNDQWKYALKDKHDKALVFIDNCIETIRHKGLYKPPKTNFLQRLDNSTLWTIIPFIVSGLLTLGFLGGQYFTDTKNFKLEQQVKELKDSLFLLRQSIRPTLVIPDNVSDSATKNTDTTHQ